MFARKLLLSALFLSSAASAQNPAPSEQVISNVSAEIVDGSNLLYTRVRVSGLVKIGGNECQTNNFDFAITKVQKNGQNLLVTVATPKKEQKFCTLEFRTDFKGVAISDIVSLRKSTKLDQVYVANVDKQGNLVNLAKLLKTDSQPTNPANCNEPVFCPLDFRPTTCTDKQGQRFSGNNRCSAVANAQKAYCLKGEVLNSKELSCVANGAEF